MHSSNISSSRKGIHMRTIGSLEREDMIFQLTMNTRYTEEALSKLSNEKLIELYQTRVEQE